MAANPARGQLNMENDFPPCLRSRLRIWSRETGSAVPSRVSPFILHNQAESDWLMEPTHGIPLAFRDSVYIYRILSTAIGSVPSLSGHATSACSFSTIRPNLELTHGTPSPFRDGVHINGVMSTATKPVPKLSSHAIASRWRSQPKVRRHKARSPPR